MRAVIDKLKGRKGFVRLYILISRNNAGLRMIQAEKFTEAYQSELIVR